MGIKKLPGDREIPWDIKAFGVPRDPLRLKIFHGDQEIPLDLKAFMGTKRFRGT